MIGRAQQNEVLVSAFVVVKDVTPGSSRGLSKNVSLLPNDSVPHSPRSGHDEEPATHGAKAPGASPQELSVPVAEARCHRILLEMIAIVEELTASDLLVSAGSPPA